AIASFRRVASVSSQLAQALSQDTKQRLTLAEVCLGVGHHLRTTGAPAESSAPLELARILFEGLVREEPGNLRPTERLSENWYQLGQTRRTLGRHEEALAAYRQSAQVMRTA